MTQSQESRLAKLETRIESFQGTESKIDRLADEIHTLSSNMGELIVEMRGESKHNRESIARAWLKIDEHDNQLTSQDKNLATLSERLSPIFKVWDKVTITAAVAILSGFGMAAFALYVIFQGNAV